MAHNFRRQSCRRQDCRRYGLPPYATVLIHGGPGAGGEMAPVARELAPHFGVLEPIQTAVTLEGQVEELRQVLEKEALPPVTLVGYSWGAWLGWITTARFPALVRRLVMVSSGPFAERDVAQLAETRRQRLTPLENEEFAALLQALADPAAKGKDALLARLGALAAKTDSFDPLQDEENDDSTGPRGDIFHAVWNEAAAMRRSGALLELAQDIHCPVSAIHGDYDPHPAQGVFAPLAARLEQFNFHLLEHCGHTPWKECLARERFYDILIEEISR